jgi:ribosomal protein S14
MKKLIKKDKKNRLFVKNKEITRLIFKLFIKNSKLSTSITWTSCYFLNNYIKKKSICFLNNCCIFTGNRTSLNLKFKVSRITFLKFSRLTQIYGLKKIYW